MTKLNAETCTKEQVKNTKIKIRDRAHSIFVQNVLFSLGYSWNPMETNRDVKHTDKKYLYINDINTLGYGDSLEYFESDYKHNEILLDPVEDESEVKGHVHAKAMAEYAQDALTHERPWELWEVVSQVVDALQEIEGRQLITHPKWHPYVNYRRIERHVVNGVSLVKSPVKAGDSGTFVCVDLTKAFLISTVEIENLDEYDVRLSRGLLYPNTENWRTEAKKHALALLGRLGKITNVLG